MSKVIVLGSGFAGHTAALYLRKLLDREHEVHVISALPYFQYIPSLVWVGVGHMAPEDTYFELAPVYRRQGIRFTHAAATKINVESQTVTVKTGEVFPYDYLINATGPYLNFDSTPGLGPQTGNSYSICNPPHAMNARDHYLAVVDQMRQGKNQTIIVGTGHPGATCHGAAFEYVQNIHFDLVAKGIRDKCRLIWFSNEPQLGDFGMGGFTFRMHGQLQTAEELTAWIMNDCNIETMTGCAPTRIEKGKLYWEDIAGAEGILNFDYAMLIPQFVGQKILYTNDADEDLNSLLCNPAGFLKVDGDYSSGAKSPDQWSAKDWPSTYQSPHYPNLFAAGIAFAPPHPISLPSGVTKSGIKVHATPPRTGMVSNIIGRIVAENIAGMIERQDSIPHRHESMSAMPAACIASQRKSIFSGSAVMTALYPVVPDFDKYSAEHGGRDLQYTIYEVGKANAWIKRFLHSMFMYKMKAKPGWSFIPE